MTVTEWIGTYGEPKDWELATALLEQIATFRRAAKILADGPGESPKVRLSAMMRDSKVKTDEEWKTSVREWATERVSQPVVDVEAAKAKVNDISQSGGWASFITHMRTDHEDS